MAAATQTPEQMMAEINALKAENVRLAEEKAKATTRRVSLKVSGKGAVSLYGLGRFPVTLYVEQWETVLDMDSDIREFMAANKAQLKRKGDATDQG